jgi:hypothetical protein
MIAIDANQQVRGVGNDIQRPMGAPPGPPPSMAIKPPPMAPPPRGLVQTQQRPAPENIKPVDPNALNKKPSLVNVMSPNAANNPNANQLNPRAPPPRFPGAPINGDIQLSDNLNGVNKGAAPPKFSESARPQMPKKPGAVSMFDKPNNQPQEVAPAKGPLPPNAPRPGPPPRGPGLAASPNAPSQPSPQQSQQSMVPTEPTADPTVAPKARIPRPLPPKPQPAGIPEGVPLPPEDKPDKEGVKDPAPVKPVPNRNRAPPKDDPEAEENKRKQQAKSEIKPPDTEAPFVKGRKVAAEEEYVPRRQRADPEFESSSSEEDANGVKIKKIRTKKPVKPEPGTTVVPQSPATPAQQLQTAGSPAPAPAVTPSTKQLPPSEPTDDAIKLLAQHAEESPRIAEQAIIPSPAPAPKPSAVADKDVPPVDVRDEVMGTDVIAAPLGGETTHADSETGEEGFALDFQSKIAQNLRNGRLSIRCIAGIDVRRKDDLNKIPRTDPYLRYVVTRQTNVASVISDDL